MIVNRFRCFHWHLFCMTDSDSFWRIYCMLYFRDGNIVFRDYNPFIRRSRAFRCLISIFSCDRSCYYHTSLYLGSYKCFLVIYTLNSYVGSLIFLGCTISAVVSGCWFSFLFLLICFDLSGSVLLLNYLLTGLLIVIVNCCNYRSLINSACRPPLEIS